MSTSPPPRTPLFTLGLIIAIFATVDVYLTAPGINSWFDKTFGEQPLSSEDYTAAIRETIQAEAALSCDIDTDCPALDEGTVVDDSTALHPEVLPEGEPVHITRYNNALLKTIAEKQWDISEQIKDFPFERGWYIADRNTMVSPMYLKDERHFLLRHPRGNPDTPVTLSLWRFDDTLYVVTGTPESLTLNEPQRTVDDVEGAESLTRSRVDAAFAPTVPTDIFDLIVELDGQLYRVETNGVLTPYPFDLPDEEDYYILPVPTAE